MHFLVGVLVEPDYLNGGITDRVEALLEPYSEDNETLFIDEELECICGGKKADCPYCEGSGVQRHNYNPYAEWDWYQFLGNSNCRFNDVFRSGIRVKHMSDEERARLNAAVVPQLGKEATEYWVHSGDAHFDELLNARPDWWVVGVDCHI